MKAAASAAAIEAWRYVERSAEGPGKRFERTVIRLERDPGYRQLRRSKLPGRTLQQETPPHGPRRLLDHGLEETKEARPAPVEPSGHIVHSPGIIERTQHHCRDRIHLAHEQNLTALRRSLP